MRLLDQLSLDCALLRAGSTEVAVLLHRSRVRSAVVNRLAPDVADRLSPNGDLYFAGGTILGSTLIPVLFMSEKGITAQ